ncbi:unnamed protein product [Periconia digitata]|uniref:Uncharacterized protein n=1 Tax=Periconia digitata TaxID=1303443 RepID=A0A9W4UBE2_9PLEO|nr:unnamed protein product [Periconia digitata]
MRLLSLSITFLFTFGVLARPVKDTTITPSGELQFTEDPGKAEEPEDAQLFFLWDPETKSESEVAATTSY